MRPLEAALVGILRGHGEAYVTGGAVRDYLIGRPSDDLDLAVPASYLPELQATAERAGARWFSLDAERGMYRAADPAAQGHVDVLVYPEDITSDLGRRDLTVNAMAVPVADWPPGSSGQVLDPHGGLQDIKDRVIRAVRLKNLVEDPLRIMRVPRIANQLGWRIEPETRRFLSANASAVSSVAAERIRDELYAVLASRRAESGIRLLDSLSLLNRLFPELDEARGVEQPKAHHYWDVFEHLIHSVGKAEGLLDNNLRGSDPFIRIAPWRQEIQAYFGEVAADGQTRATLLKLAALLHDVAKPRCKTVDAHGRMRFFGHSEVGEQMVVIQLERMRCSRRAVAHVSTMVRHHLRPSQMGFGVARATPTDRAIFRYWKDLGGVAMDTLYLCLADYLAARGPAIDLEGWFKFTSTIDAILSGGFVSPGATKPFLLLNGNEIIARFGLAPGPEIGRLLGALKEAEAGGQVQTRQQAVELIDSLLQGRNAPDRANFEEPSEA